MKFEGPEKKLELVLRKPRGDLRGNQDGKWDKIVSSAYTHILSSCGNAWFDAYLLSESSLFVYDSRIVLITCGKSQLYRSVPALLELLEPSEIEYLFYERKNFFFPAEQLSDFDEETREMATVFPGRKFVFGPEHDDHVLIAFASMDREDRKERGIRPDVTLEILMQGISQEIARFFYAGKGKKAEVMRKMSGIESIFGNGVTILYDDYMFDPCGYSLNGLSEQAYFTIHVTPQDICSYVSFETNLLLDDYDELIEKVLDCFLPKRFTFVLTRRDREKFTIPARGRFVETYSQESHLGGGYHVSFANFVWDGLAPGFSG